MVHGNLRWTVLLVHNAKKTAAFYEQVFGWQRWWDNKVDLDARFHPVAFKSIVERANAHLIIMGEGESSKWADDYNAPCIALTEYSEEIGDVRDHARKTLSCGDFVLMIHAEDIDGIYQRAIDIGGRSSSLPSDWTVPHPEGLGTIKFRTASFFDPEGNYIEVTKKLHCPTWNKLEKK